MQQLHASAVMRKTHLVRQNGTSGNCLINSISEAWEQLQPDLTCSHWTHGSIQAWFMVPVMMCLLWKISVTACGWWQVRGGLLTSLGCRFVHGDSEFSSGSEVELDFFWVYQCRGLVVWIGVKTKVMWPLIMEDGYHVGIHIWLLCSNY